MLADSWGKPRGRRLLSFAAVLVGCLTLATAARADIYWSNWNNGNGTTIGHAASDGGGVNQSFITTNAAAGGLAAGTEYLYWSNVGHADTGNIGRAKLDGTDRDNSFMSGVSATALVVDAQHIYWTHGAEYDRRIGRADINGSNTNEEYLDLPDNTVLQTGLAIDSQYLYVAWVKDTGHGYVSHVGRFKLDRTASDPTWLGPGNIGVAGIAVTADSIYYTNVGTNGERNLIGRATINGDNPTYNWVELASTVGGGMMAGVAASSDALYFAEPKNDTIGRFVPYVGSDEDFITGAIDPRSIALTGTTITPHSTSTVVTCSPASVTVGSATTCTATVTDTTSTEGAAPTGTVSFSSDSAGAFSASACTLAAVNATSASCTVTYRPHTVKAAHLIAASYAGSGTHKPSTGTTNVAARQSPTTTTVACLPGSVTAGSASQCTATVSDIGEWPTTPTGSVSFTSDSSGAFAAQSCALSPLDGSRAECRVTYTPRTVGSGAHTIAGGYSGDTGHAASSGSARVMVTPPPAPEVCRDRLGPVSRFDRRHSSLTHKRIALAGATTDRGGCTANVADARDRGGVSRVRIAVALQVRGSCRPLLANRKWGRAQSCRKASYNFTASGTTRWKLTVRTSFPAGRYRVFAMGFDLRGNPEPYDPLMRNSLQLSLR